MKTAKRRVLLSVVVSVVAAAATLMFAPRADTTDITHSEPAPLRLSAQTQAKFTLNITAGGKRSTENVSDTMLGDALTGLGLIDGTVGSLGLMVETVNGKAASDADHTYWAFYVNGGYAATGVDLTPVKAGETYTFALTDWDTNAARPAELTVTASDYVAPSKPSGGNSGGAAQYITTETTAATTTAATTTAATTTAATTTAATTTAATTAVTTTTAATTTAATTTAATTTAATTTAATAAAATTAVTAAEPAVTAQNSGGNSGGNGGDSAGGTDAVPGTGVAVSGFAGAAVVAGIAAAVIAKKKK